MRELRSVVPSDVSLKVPKPVMAPLGELQGGAGFRHLGELVIAAVDQALAGTALGHLVVTGACRASKGLQLCLKSLKLYAAGRDRLLQVRVAALEELRKLDLLGEEGSADLPVARAEDLVVLSRLIFCSASWAIIAVISLCFVLIYAS